MKLSRVRLLVTIGVALVLLGGAAAFARCRRGADNTPDHWTRTHLEARADHLARLPLPPGAIVLVGDSLTERAEWRELLGRGDVYNRGISGDTAAGVRARLAPLVKASPRALTLMIGINDLEAGRAVEAVRADVDAIVAEVQRASPTTKIVVVSVLPMRDVGRGLGVAADQVAALNGALEGVCTARGAEFLDLRPTLTDGQGALAADATLDGVHLTGDGYARWAAALAPRLPPP